jgi:hypothetical protein
MALTNCEKQKRHREKMKAAGMAKRYVPKSDVQQEREKRPWEIGRDIGGESYWHAVGVAEGLIAGAAFLMGAAPSERAVELLVVNALGSRRLRELHIPKDLYDSLVLHRILERVDERLDNPMGL